MENIFQPWTPKFVESARYPCGIPPRPTLSYLPLDSPCSVGTLSVYQRLNTASARHCTRKYKLSVSYMRGSDFLKGNFSIFTIFS